ncbi:MAG: hypothetical protein FWD73_14890 [Polyangiaceae bacterium]|nr:hypothetical protein [Polyangiaceae bacterium]
MTNTGDDTQQSPSLSCAETSQLWAKFRAGDTILCAKDAHGIALAVDSASKVYRFICTKCGLASPWFGTTPAGLVFRTPPAMMNHRRPNGSDL